MVVYQSPDISSRELTLVEKNVWFEVISKGDKFNKIRYKGDIGYILSSYPLK